LGQNRLRVKRPDHGGSPERGGRDVTKNSVPDDDSSGTVVSGAAAEPPAVPTQAASPAAEQVLPGEIVPGDARASDATAAAVVRLADPDLPAVDKRRALGEIAASLRRRGFKDIVRPKAAMAWVADMVVDVAPRIPVRSAERLREHFPGLTEMQIAERLVRNAARTNAGIGIVGGGVSSIQWVAPPTLLTAPVLLAAETVAVVAVEIKLIGELQELDGQPVAGNQADRAISLLQAWAGRRGVSLIVPGRGVAAVLGTAARHELRDRLVRRFGRNLTTLGPVFTGAAVAAWLNRRATLHLAEEVRKDLARKRPPAITSD
jgi:hypothetical protein